MTEKRWRGVLKCRDCGAVLNTTKRLLDDDEKRRANVSSALAAGPCPNGCRSTFSDLNINTRLEWEEARA